MSLEIVTAGPDSLLTSVAAVKTTLGISDSDNDEFIGDLIAAASQFVENYCGRQFAKQTYLEHTAGSDLPDMLLSVTPIISVSEVLFDTTEIPADEYRVNKDIGFLQRRTGWRSTNLPWNTISYHPSSYEEERYHITYIAGYVLPGWEADPHGARTLPYDLERAVINMVSSNYQNRERDAAMTSYKIGETSASWKSDGSDQFNQTGLPASITGVLNYYRRAF